MIVLTIYFVGILIFSIIILFMLKYKREAAIMLMGDMVVYDLVKTPALIFVFTSFWPLFVITVPLVVGVTGLITGLNELMKKFIN